METLNNNNNNNSVQFYCLQTHRNTHPIQPAACCSKAPTSIAVAITVIFVHCAFSYLFSDAPTIFASTQSANPLLVLMLFYAEKVHPKSHPNRPSTTRQSPEAATSTGGLFHPQLHRQINATHRRGAPLHQSFPTSASSSSSST